MKAFVSLVLLAACEQPSPPRAAEVPVAPPRAPPLTKLGEFDLAAPSYDLAKLYPKRRITNDGGLVSIQGNEASYLFATLSLVPDTFRVKWLTVKHVRTFEAFKSEHPDATCTKDERSVTTCTVPEEPELEYFGDDRIKDVIWTPTSPHTVIIDPNAPLRYPQTLRDRCTRILERADECEYAFKSCDLLTLERLASIEAKDAAVLDVALSEKCTSLRAALLREHL